jgi:hypothetical protein
VHYPLNDSVSRSERLAGDLVNSHRVSEVTKTNQRRWKRSRGALRPVSGLMGVSR